MSLFEKFVGGLTDENVIELVKDYEKLKVNGCIGDCLLRYSADEMFPDNPYVSKTMELIAFEAYRKIALAAIEISESDEVQ